MAKTVRQLQRQCLPEFEGSNSIHRSEKGEAWKLVVVFVGQFQQPWLS